MSSFMEHAGAPTFPWVKVVLGHLALGKPDSSFLVRQILIWGAEDFRSFISVGFQLNILITQHLLYFSRCGLSKVPTGCEGAAVPGHPKAEGMI